MQKNTFYLFLIVSTLIGCKTTPPPPTKEDIAKGKIEAILSEGLNDPNSYEFDTIYCVHAYTVKNQFDIISELLSERTEQYTEWVNTAKNQKERNDYNKWLSKNISIKNRLDSLVATIPSYKLQDTIGRCFSFHFRANNSFGGKVKGEYYFYANKNNDITNWFQVERKSKAPFAMVLPILDIPDYSLRNFLAEGDIMYGYENHYIYEFNKYINTK